MRVSDSYPHDTGLPIHPAVIDGLEYYRLFNAAEGVRWQISEINWEEVDHDAVRPELVDIVAGIAASEVTTWSASRMFLEGFADEVDFTQWVSVWLYEETKHPYVLMQWLRQVGRTFDESFISLSRDAHPFIRSKVGTIAMNILSEIEASSIYMGLSLECPEPVLKRITRMLAGDEARHAAGFYTFARKMLSASADPRGDRREILRVLYFWLNSYSDLKHPVAIISHSLFGEQTLDHESRGHQFRRNVQHRMLGMIGSLLDLPLDGREGLIRAIRSAGSA